MPIFVPMEKSYDVLIVGGGAAGFFTAINLAEALPDLRLAILERGKEVLNKVRISGGGRCNVTHAEFLPKELAQQYPRGNKELLGPFHRFMTGDTMAWFEDRGVKLKIEEDGRIFPVSDRSESIIDCFLSEASRLGIKIIKSCPVKTIEKTNEKWNVSTTQGEFFTKKMILCTGSNPKVWNLLKNLNHTIVPAVPSLFTFNCKDPRLSGLAGISTQASVKIKGSKLEDDGPLLITHWGFSGPAVLKLSAWGARFLSQKSYQFIIEVNWLPQNTSEEIKKKLGELKLSMTKKQVQTHTQFGLPKRLWLRLLTASEIPENQKWANLTKKHQRDLTAQLCDCQFEINGKSTFKEEFVTAGGINLKEVDFKTFESKLQPGLFFAGEILNIDAVTGGFNFQNAWTGGFLIAQTLAKDDF